MLPDVGFLFLLHSIKEVWQQPCDEILNSAVFFLPTEKGQDTFLGQSKMLDRKDFKGEKYQKRRKEFRPSWKVGYVNSLRLRRELDLTLTQPTYEKRTNHQTIMQKPAAFSFFLLPNPLKWKAVICHVLNHPMIYLVLKVILEQGCLVSEFQVNLSLTWETIISILD